jgi:hypothetical protein
MNSRGPNRSASAPMRFERKNMMKVNGRNAAPAATAV